MIASAFVLALVLVLGAPVLALAAEPGATPAAVVAGDGAGRGSGWQVDQRPLWRLQLRGLAGDFGSAPSAYASPAAGGRALDTGAARGAFFGYQFGIGDDERDAIGINLQVGGDSRDAYERLLLQPGIEYQMPLATGWQLNARLFSTYSSDGMGERRDLQRGEGVGAGGFRDVGLGVGLDYHLGTGWNVKTQAGVTRNLDETRASGGAEDGKTATQYFGGVIINYRF